MRGGQQLLRAAVSFVVAVTVVALMSAYMAEPDEMSRWRVGLTEAIRFSPLAVAISAGQVWGQRPYPVWPGLVMIAAYGAGAVAVAARLGERGMEYAIELWLIMLPISLGEFLLFRWLTRRNAVRARQQPPLWQPRA